MTDTPCPNSTIVASCFKYIIPERIIYSLFIFEPQLQQTSLSQGTPLGLGSVDPQLGQTHILVRPTGALTCSLSFPIAGAALLAWALVLTAPLASWHALALALASARPRLAAGITPCRHLSSSTLDCYTRSSSASATASGKSALIPHSTIIFLALSSSRSSCLNMTCFT